MARGSFAGVSLVGSEMTGFSSLGKCSSLVLFLCFSFCYCALNLLLLFCSSFPRLQSTEIWRRRLLLLLGRASAPSSRRCMGDHLVAAAAPAPALFSGHTAGLGRQGSTQGKKCRWPLNIAYPPSNILLYANVCAVRREDHAAAAPESRVIREGEGWSPAAAAAAPARRRASPSSLPSLLSSSVVSSACNGNLRVVEWYREGPPRPQISGSRERAMNSQVCQGLQAPRCTQQNTSINVK